ncbi:sn-glycerol-1-phosphate dehydrogenase [Cohnella luojiensis]|uniref:sn-glycerol-1-phosphate dehydrogenase n=1 Tax=Cohnella luojiensis TaxID=652876 RepID=A0A4Y8LVF2_9BACL|nr:sn-glycerol-1-phosphate dehydrogenase [Cohnella luojiensis]TFE25792.1 sn-glycerol-1-phosphate dehydrogenase [Cohnella luojiensis]
MSIIEPVLIEAGAIRQVAPYLLRNRLQRISIAADSNTFEVVGRVLGQLIENAGMNVCITLINPDKQGDVIADEASVVQLELDLKQSSAEIVLAVGSGTLHDIARFSAYAVGIPFVSVPTAPSVDGFNSIGAPLIIRGEKKTIAAIGPSAIFADLDLLTKAPDGMIAAGFGDMLGKYTSLFDWKFGSLAGGEPYSEAVAEQTRHALQLCVDNCEEIEKRSPKGIEILTRALIESGFAMLKFGQSHPASGAEHHLSHYWEMEFMRLGRRQILHGAKVGVACAEISRLYHGLAIDSPELFPEEHRQTLLEEIDRIPGEHAIKQLLLKVGGPTSPEQLGVSGDLLSLSMREAHHIRSNRHTLLKKYNEKKAAPK